MRGQKQVNKSKAIREQLNQTPEAGPQEIVRLLAAQGVKTTPALVSNIKSKLAAVRNAVGHCTVPSSLPATAVVEAKLAADRIGGVANLKEACQVLEALAIS